MDKAVVLARSKLFEMLSSQELEYVAELSKPKRIPAGKAVFEEGEPGDSLYLIATGQVEVVRKDVAGNMRVIATLGSPDFFGEMSLIDKDFRSATVRAKSDVELLQLTAENLTTFRKLYRDGFTFVAINIARTLSARLRDANAKLTVRA